MTDRWQHIPFAPARWPFFYGWTILVVGAIGIVMSAPGQTMGVAVFTDPLLEALDLSRVQLSLAYLLGTVGSALLLPRAGRWYDRYGARVLGPLACLSLGMVLLVLSRIDHLAAWVTTVTGLAGAAVAFATIACAFFFLRFWGQGIMTLASQNMIMEWFDHRRGLANGLSGIVVALGFSGAPLLLDLLVRQMGWREAWMLMGVVIGGLFLLVALVLYRNTPESCGLLPDGARPAANATPHPSEVVRSFTAPEARRCPAFWIFAGGMALVGLYMTGLAFHLISLFANAGLTRTEAVAIFLPAALIGVSLHLGGGWLSDRIPLKYLLAVLLLGMILSTTGMITLARGLPYWSVIVGNGIAGGLFGLLSAVTWPRYFGRKHLGAISGMNMALAVFCSALGPYLFSQFYAMTGSYRAAGAICLVAACIMLVTTFMAHNPQDALREAAARAAPSDQQHTPG